MAWKAVIAGVDKTTSLDQTTGASIDLRLNDRAQARFLCKAGYVPDRFDDVVLYAQDGTTKLFGGIVLKRTAEARGFDASHQYRTRVDCTDYMTYADWSFTSRVYSTSVTLKTVLQDLITDCLSAYGISLDSGQVTGPTLPAFSWNNTRASDALRSLFTSTGFVARIDPDKVLKMFVPGTDAAPFAMTTASPHSIAMTWADSDFTPANNIILSCGPSGTNNYVQSWTQAGGATSWQADIPEAAGAAPPGYVTVGGVFKTVGPGAQYEWDTGTTPPTLRLGTDSTPTNGTVITITYLAQYPFVVTATSGGSPVITELFSDETITTLASGQAAADGLLAALDQQPLVLSATSRDVGWLPGQLLTVNFTYRDLNTTFTIQAIQIRLQTNSIWFYDINATESTTYQGTNLDQWRSLLSVGSGTAIALSGSGGTGSVATTLTAPYPLGGSREQAVAPAASTWTPAYGFVRFRAPGTFTARIRVDLWSRQAANVTARLYDETAAAAVTGMTTSAVNSSTPTEVTASGVVTSGHNYRLEFESNTSNVPCFCTGFLEAA